MPHFSAAQANVNDVSKAIDDIFGDLTSGLHAIDNDPICLICNIAIPSTERIKTNGKVCHHIQKEANLNHLVSSFIFLLSRYSFFMWHALNVVHAKSHCWSSL